MRKEGQEEGETRKGEAEDGSKKGRAGRLLRTWRMGRRSGEGPEEEQWKKGAKMKAGKSRRTVQIFVKVDGSKVFPMAVSLHNDVSDVVRRILSSARCGSRAVYVTSSGRVLRKSEELRTCGVTEGNALQVMIRMRGGGKRKDKKSKAEEKEAASPQKPAELERDESLAHRECNQDEVFRMTEPSENFQKMVMEGSVIEVVERIRNYLTAVQKSMGWDEERMDDLGERIRGTVEEQRRERPQERQKVMDVPVVHRWTPSLRCGRLSSLSRRNSLIAFFSVFT